MIESINYTMWANMGKSTWNQQYPCREERTRGQALFTGARLKQNDGNRLRIGEVVHIDVDLELNGPPPGAQKEVNTGGNRRQNQPRRLVYPPGLMQRGQHSCYGLPPE